MEMKELEKKKKKLLKCAASSKKRDSDSSLESSSGHLSHKKFTVISVEDSIDTTPSPSPLPHKEDQESVSSSHHSHHHTHVSAIAMGKKDLESDFGSHHHQRQSSDKVEEGHSWSKHSGSSSPLQSGGMDLSSPSHEKWSEASSPSDARAGGGGGGQGPHPSTFTHFPLSPTGGGDGGSGYSSSARQGSTVSREDSSEWTDFNSVEVGGGGPVSYSRPESVDEDGSCAGTKETDTDPVIDNYVHRPS